MGSQRVGHDWTTELNKFLNSSIIRYFQWKRLSSVQKFSSVTRSCPTLCDPMNCSTPGLPVHHHFPEFTQTHVHRVSDAIQPSHPLSSPCLPAPNPSQDQSLFQWVNSSHEVTKVLEDKVGTFVPTLQLDKVATYKWELISFVFPFLTYFTKILIIPSRYIHVIAKGKGQNGWRDDKVQTTWYEIKKL